MSWKLGEMCLLPNGIKLNEKSQMYLLLLADRISGFVQQVKGNNMIDSNQIQNWRGAEGPGAPNIKK